MRNQFGGHAVDRAGGRRRSRTPAADRRRRLDPADQSPSRPVARRPPVPPRLPLLRRRRGRARSRASPRSSGRNGQGKTNLVEAIDYLSRLSRRTGSPPTRRWSARGADQAVVRAAVVARRAHGGARGRDQPGQGQPRPDQPSRRCRGPASCSGWCARWCSPEDLALVKGDPTDRRRFLDDLLVLRAPRLAGVRADYDRVLKQRNTLLKTAGGRRARQRPQRGGAVDPGRLGRPPGRASGPSCWPRGSRWSTSCAPLRRQGLRGGRPGRDAATTPRSPTSRRFDAGRAVAHRPLRDARPQALLAELERRRKRRARPRASRWSARTATTCSAHAGASRLPVKGYASHGESWSFALALRLASYDLLRADGDDPVLILDDVFAELDTDRRDQLAELVAGAEQVLVTAAVAADVPDALAGRRFDVADGEVTPCRLTSRPADRRTTPPTADADGRRATTTTGLDLARAIARGLAARPTAAARDAAQAGAARAPRRRATAVSGAHPDDRDPQLLGHRRSAGSSPSRAGRPTCGCTGSSAAGTAIVGDEVAAALHARVVRRRPARRPHRLDGVGDPAEAARPDRRTPAQRGARRTAR